MKKIYNFPKKSELPTFILPVKISRLIFSAVSGVEMKNLQRSEHAHFLVSWLLRMLVRQFLPTLQREPRRLISGRSGTQYVAMVTKFLISNCGAPFVESYCKELVFYCIPYQ